MTIEHVKEIYDGHVIKVNVETVVLPNGHRTELDMVHHPGAAAVVPLDDNNHVYLIKQYRHAAGGYIYEVPAGKLDAGEQPEACARRELIEEAGVEAQRWDLLSSILTTPGFSDEVIHLFLARDLKPAQQQLEVDEVLTVESVAFAEAIAMCREGVIRDGKSICALLLAQMRLDSA